jgi:hypothetical protein
MPYGSRSGFLGAIGTSTGNGGSAMATRDYAYAEDVPRGIGWVTFAGIMLGLIGTFNILDGIVALSRSSFFVANARFVFSDLRTWGWIIIIIGAVQLVASVGIFSGSEVARWFGIAVAALNALAQLGFASAYPWWAISMFALDILVIYGLAVYGGARLGTHRSSS